MLRFQLVLTALLGGGLAVVQPPTAARASPAFSGAAKAAIEQRLGPGKMGRLIDGHNFYGDFDGDGSADVLAIAYLSGGGNSFDIEAFLLRQEAGRFVFAGKAEIFGDQPRDVRFAKGSVQVTTRMPKPGDPRCCPTGSRTWTIAVSPGAGSVGTTSAAGEEGAGGTLGRKRCDATSGESIVFKGGTLVIDTGGDETTYRGVRFGGCEGQRCTYSLPAQKLTWRTTRRGDEVDVAGPFTASDGRRLTLVNLTRTFGPCR